MLIYLWVKSEPYGLVSLKTHKEFRIKGTALGKFVLCFTEHVVLKKIEQGCCWCSTTVITIAECSLCAGTGAWWFPPVISRHLPHDPGSLEVGRGWGVERIPYRVSSPEPSVLIACRNFGQNGETGFVQQRWLFLLKSLDSETKNTRICRSAGLLRSHSQYTFSLFNELLPA